ncbi:MULTISPECIES: phage tail protein [Pseudoalteromonas]|uniref:Phage tail protein n=1 Tax=Pseudoalteromonas amylolytica TaxID=1859457 RepID=A0A1S1MR72_9GAMM|nr:MULTISPECIES: phage tail protein [Pseudoalteromonas]OHU87815.1 phage tail protein [Pseudoalteromonas sp. JW3]OHU91255.1 phage tail protein [Pseudoalteromonas amylolytica]
MSTYQPIITQAGLNAAVNAKEKGLSVHLSHIAIGDQGYTPERTQTQLKNERDRVPTGDAVDFKNGQFRVSGKFTSDTSYSVKEVGFFLSDGTLFAVWSHPTNVLFYLTPLATVVQGFDLLLSAAPHDAITVTHEGDLRLYYDDVFLHMTQVQTNMLISQLETNLTIVNLYNELAQKGVLS